MNKTIVYGVEPNHLLQFINNCVDFTEITNNSKYRCHHCDVLITPLNHKNHSKSTSIPRTKIEIIGDNIEDINNVYSLLYFNFLSAGA